jgi:glutathione S-transferase
MIVLFTTERDYPWGTLRSTHASKTKVVLEEKRIPYRIENLPPGHLWKKPPELTAHHPLGKVPYIVDGDLTVYDSTVIGEYLEDCYSWPLLIPHRDPRAAARVRMIEQFGDEALLAGNLPPIWMPYWSEPDQRDKQRMEKGRDGLRKRDLPYIEQLLAGGGDWICGDFSMADVPMMVLAMVLEVDQMPLDGLPRVAQYLERLRGRRSYRAISARTKVAEASSLSTFA